MYYQLEHQMKKIPLVIMLFAFTSNLAFASDTEKEAKIAQIFTAQKLNEQIQAQLDTLKGDQFERLTKRIFDKSLSDHPKSSTISKERTTAILTHFVKKCGEGLTVEAVIKDVAKVYGEGLMIEDINNILSYYQSPAGKKDVAATLKVATVIGGLMYQILDVQITEQIPELIKELDKAAIE
jgi:hypothetical protein